MSKGKIKILTVFLLTLITFVGIGVAFLYYGFSHTSFDSLFIGILLVVSSIPSILLYFLLNSYKSPRKMPYVVLSVSLFTCGLVFIIAPEISLDHASLLWGILDILISAFVIIDAFVEIKDNKIKISEMIIGAINLVFGVLLCIHLGEGVSTHLIVMGFIYIVKAIRSIFELMLALKQLKKNQSN